MTLIIHQTQRIARTIAITGGTKIMLKLSLTKSVAVFMTAIANLILLNMHMKPITHRMNQAKIQQDTINRA